MKSGENIGKYKYKSAWKKTTQKPVARKVYQKKQYRNFKIMMKSVHKYIEKHKNKKRKSCKRIMVPTRFDFNENFNNPLHIELFLLSYFVDQFDNVNNCIIMPRGKSSHSQMFFEIGVLKHFVIFTGKNLCGDSNIVFFLWILWIFYQQLFCRTPLVAGSVAITGQEKQRDILRKHTLWIFLLKYNDAKN